MFWAALVFQAMMPITLDWVKDWKLKRTQQSGCHAGSMTPLTPAAHNYMQTGSWYDTPDDDGYVDSDESAPPSDDEDLDDDDELPPCMCFQDLH